MTRARSLAVAVIGALALALVIGSDWLLQWLPGNPLSVRETGAAEAGHRLAISLVVLAPVVLAIVGALWISRSGRPLAGPARIVAWIVGVLLLFWFVAASIGTDWTLQWVPGNPFGIHEASASASGHDLAVGLKVLLPLALIVAVVIVGLRVRAGGPTVRMQTALITAGTLVLALAVGALAVVVAGGNPMTVYKQLLQGAGSDWLVQWIPGNPAGIHQADAAIGATNLISTINETTPLILAGLAVGFAFRCGLFNIGGQGQFIVGAISTFAVADRVGGPGGIILGVLAGIVAGIVWGAIPGALKAYRGAHEVISTIMLNFVALYIGEYLVAVNGPMQGGTAGIPSSATLPESSWLPSFWSAGGLDAHTGLLIALVAVVIYWLILERTVLGYAVRAVGSNPEAARYGGISVPRSVVLSMAIAGAFAGLAGSVDLLGNSDHAIVQSNLQVVQLGFTGIAVALLGRNNAVGIVLGAILFATLDSGSRAVGGGISPELARALAQVIQGTIILLVGGETIVAWLLRRRRSEIEPPTLTPTAANIEEAI